MPGGGLPSNSRSENLPGGAQPTVVPCAPGSVWKWMVVVWLSHEQDCSCHLVGERQGHWTSYRMQTVPSKMPAVALWTDTSQGPPGTDREVKPREGLGPAEIGLAGDRKNQRLTSPSLESQGPPSSRLQQPEACLGLLGGRLPQGTQVTSVHYRDHLPSQECHGNSPGREVRSSYCDLRQIASSV